MTFYGQRLTQEFIKEVEQVPDKGENSGNYQLGLLPYYYDKASQFYGKIFENEDKETYDTETIKIETTRYSRPKVKKQIDLDSLDMGDDEQ